MGQKINLTDTGTDCIKLWDCLENHSGTARSTQACKLNWNRTEHSNQPELHFSLPQRRPVGVWVLLPKFWREVGVHKHEVRVTGLVAALWLPWCNEHEQHRVAQQFSSLLLLRSRSVSVLTSLLSPACSCLTTVMHQHPGQNGSLGIPAVPHQQAPCSLQWTHGVTLVQIQ